MTTEVKKVLCVGLVCLDIVQECNSFPEEDSDQRCLNIHWQRGGNASNNCTILSQIGVACEFLGTMSSDSELDFIRKDFLDHGICIEHCPMMKTMARKSFLDSFPVSTVLINVQNGSRTIIHSKGMLPEVSLERFKELELSQYSWIHFEGRNNEAVSAMIDYIREWRSIKCPDKCPPSPIVSVELEKPKPGLLPLACHADVIFMGKDFALYNGWNGMESALEGLSNHVKDGAVIVCAWGEQGSSAIHLLNTDPQNAVLGRCLSDGHSPPVLHHSPAYPPPIVMDTLGAGDTFVAGFIRAFLFSLNLPKALEFACRLAGAKVGMKGFSGIKEAYSDIIKNCSEVQ